jgi:hypothetical protein
MQRSFKSKDEGSNPSGPTMQCNRCKIDDPCIWMIEGEQVCQSCKLGKYRCYICKRSFREVTGMGCWRHSETLRAKLWVCYECSFRPGWNFRAAPNINPSEQEPKRVEKEEDPPWQVCTVTFEEIDDE